MFRDHNKGTHNYSDASIHNLILEGKKDTSHIYYLGSRETSKRFYVQVSVGAVFV